MAWLRLCVLLYLQLKLPQADLCKFGFNTPFLYFELLASNIKMDGYWELI